MSQEEYDDEQQRALQQRYQEQELLRESVQRVVRKDFMNEVAQLRQQGYDVPDDEKATEQFQLCFSSENPKTNLHWLVGSYRQRPKRTGASGTSTRATAPNPRTERDQAHRAMGIQFASDDIDAGLKIGQVLDRLYAGQR